jgi:cell fate regulator YaaT (PSP1 superfamily)
MDEIMKLQDEALLYLRDNITKDEAYYILTTENEMTEVLMSKRKDGSKRIKILDAEYTIEKDDMLFLFDTDGVIDECLLVASYIGVNMYFRRQDVNAILNNINREKVMKYPYIAIQLDNIQTVEKRRVVFEITGHRMDDNKERIDFMFVYFMARML